MRIFKQAEEKVSVSDPIGINEVMEILNVSRATVYNQMKRGRIRKYKTGLGKLVFSRNEIEALKVAVK